MLFEKRFDPNLMQPVDTYLYIYILIVFNCLLFKSLNTKTNSFV